MTQIELIRLLGITSAFSILIPVSAGFLRLKAFNNILKVLFIYCILSGVIDIASLICVRYNIHNHNLLNIFQVSETIFIWTIFFLKLRIGKIRLFVPLAIAVNTLLYCILHAVLSRGIAEMAYTVFQSASIITLSIVWFRKQLIELNDEEITKNYFFFINSGLLFYFSSTLFLFLFSNFIHENQNPKFNSLWNFHSLFNIIYNVSLAIGIWRIKKE